MGKLKKSKVYFTIAATLICINANSQTTKILFDASKAETSGNADWVIDANTHNLGFNTGPAVVGQGTESNAQTIPSPSQSSITSSTSETFWNGALSYWGIDCVVQGYQVETLPYNGRITFGDISNTQDLSNYKVFIVCEPNIVFSAQEKSALINFVQNGGGLFMISDHDISDRNGDGWDSPHIWNDLMSNNTVQSNPFGISFDYDDISQTSSNIPSLPGDSILHGQAGNVTEVQWSDGTTMTLNPIQNTTVTGVIYKNGSAIGSNNVMCAYSRYGNGKIAAIGDSSPCDDGTGDLNDNLYDGYIADASGNHRKLLMNITIWLASTDIQTEINPNLFSDETINVFSNPVYDNSLSFSYTSRKNSTASIDLFDATGNIIQECSHQSHITENAIESMNVAELSSGIYFLRFKTSSFVTTKRIMIIH